MTDLEIAHSVVPKNISEIATKLNLQNNIVTYGNDKAKILVDYDKCVRNGKLILVTAISPTPLGEGKTTVSIGLVDAMNSLNKKTVAVLREPSMGPVFGIKGGATGGGYSQVIPMEDINLHFTGDFHAITSACNLLCAAIDNHIYFGNKLGIKRVLFKRCLDVNDRALRSVNLQNREENFTITAASEIMSIFCLSKDINDLRNRLGNIVIGINNDNKFVYARELDVVGSLVVLLKDAFNPNLVQTLEGSPVIIHGGPFANIAHGCNSIVATKVGLNYSDYVVTEAGFGADLGAEKYLDIKCRRGDFKPDCVVLVATIKALKYHGGVSKDDILIENNEALTKGFSNLKKHYDNLCKFGVNVVVALNKYESDTEDEINLLINYCKNNNIKVSLSTAYTDGGKGAINLASEVINTCEQINNFKYIYNLDDSIYEKINKVCSNIYGANEVTYSDKALEKIKLLEENNISNLEICIAKTQYSFSDNAKLVGVPSNFNVNVKDIDLYNGAGFITVLLGNIVTMPGLSKKPSYEKIDYVSNKIVGLS